MSDLNADLRAQVAALGVATASGHGALRGLILAQEQFRDLKAVELKTVASGEVEVEIKPRWATHQVVQFLSGSDMTPVAVEFKVGNPMTNFNLKPGLTLVVGTVGTGKTSMLLCIGEELQAEGVEVTFLTTEGREPIYDHFQPKFHVGVVENIVDLEQAMGGTTHGDAVLCDEIGILNQHQPRDAQQVGERTRRLTNMCRRLHNVAERRHIYLVVSLQAGRPMGKDKGLRIANELKHRYPILEVQGGG